MHVFLTRAFHRDAEHDGVTDGHCREAIRRAEKGLIDADLGGGLIKQRMATGNRGAAKGSRAVVFYRASGGCGVPARLPQEPQSQPDQV